MNIREELALIGMPAEEIQQFIQQQKRKHNNENTIKKPPKSYTLPRKKKCKNIN
jgi:hypothetical protein